MDHKSNIDPKIYTLNAFKGDGKRLAEVLRHYWKSVGYYKKVKSVQVKMAEDVFKTEAV